MENFKQALLIELLECELSTEKRNQLLIHLVKDNITEEELRDYQRLRQSIKSADDSGKILATINQEALQNKIMEKVRSTKTFYDNTEKYKVATINHLISAQKVKSSRFS